MTDAERTAEVIPDVPATASRRRAFFSSLFGKDKEDSAAAEPAPPAVLAPGASAEEDTAIHETAQSVSPRLTLPIEPTSSAAMPPSDPPSASPGHALAQLTFGFGITSLQLTPFFRLGALDLKALSDVVSLHLVAARAEETPLAAGISFRIDRVELDGERIKHLLLRPLDEARQMAAPLPNLQVGEVALTDGGAPITVTTAADGGATAVQLVGTFALAGIDFSPAFEVESLRLVPATHTTLLRVTPSARPTALDLSPSFDFAEVRLGDGGRLDAVRLVPSAPAGAA